MEPNRVNAAKIAQGYFNTTDSLNCLGWGISGFVFLSPDLQSAVKVHRYEQSFLREVQVYRILRQLRLHQLHGLTIPKLIDFRTDIKLIRMNVVIAPYLLDFAGVHFHPPDFPSEAMESWHAGIHELYGPNDHIVYDVYNSLMRHGLYYMDFRPSNLNLTNHPDLLPHNPSSLDND
ncbi:MAG: hypothetical protein IT446_06795 [Phycisphaerales bacterium]|nr:hypothetical protein [Phycisphaerales bacterium]